MSFDLLLRTALPMIPALAVAMLVDLATVRRGLTPPGYYLPLRRSAMTALLALLFYIGLFSPLAWLDQAGEMDPSALTTPELFALHVVILVTLLLWFVLGYGSRETSQGGPLTELVRQCGLRSQDPATDLRVGVGGGLLLWGAVLAMMMAVAALLSLGKGESLVPTEAPPLVVYMAGLPVLVRVGLSLSAGVVEEIFFRGFLQPRVGIAISGLLFVLAHASYDQPFMLLGVALLSLGFARMTQLRGSVWPAIIAHTLFDAVQLLWLIPWQVAGAPQPAANAAAALLGMAP
ncbi:MAG: CPBP family intramembrane glutamic endopeptidase [Acidobacteriota bacterium]|nr:CPBP family intramembrane glutamic endopeptidase [Acidobacteriota bacterium]